MSEGLGGFLPPLVMELVASTKEFQAKLTEAGHEVERFEGRHNTAMARMAAYGKAALFGIAGAAVGVGVASVHLADQWEVSHSKMEQSIRNTGSSVEQWQGQISATERKLESLGYTNREVDESLAVLITSTGNVKKAMQLQGTAADLARFKHLDLSQASFMLSRALQGNSRVLKQLGIDLPVNAKGAEALKVAQHNLTIQQQTYHNMLDKAHAKHKLTAADLTSLKIAHEKLRFAQQQVASAEHAHTLILDALNQKIHGQATAYAETFSGKLQTLKARTEDLGKNIGVWLVPKIETLVGWVADATTWLSKHKDIVEAVGLAIGAALVPAIVAYTASMIAAAPATIAANAPLILIAAAVGLVAYGALQLAKHWSVVWGDIKSVALDAWHFLDGSVLQPIEHAFEAVAGFISNAGHAVVRFLEQWGPMALSALLPFIGLPLVIWQHFDAIKGFLAKAWDAAYGAVKTGVTTIITFIAGLPKMILGALGDLSQLLYNAGMDVIHGFVNGIEHAAGDVKNALGSITHKLTSWKGPPEKDRRILTPAGRLVIQGFIDGIESMHDKLKTALGLFTVRAHDLMIDGGKKVASGLIKGLQSVESPLKARLNTINSQLSQTLSNAANLRTSLASSLTGSADLSNLPAGANGVTDTSAGSLVDYLSSKLASLTAFKSNLGSLVSEKLAPALVNQIAAMGADKGGAYAQSLAGASPADIANLNSLQSSIEKMSNGIGSMVSNATYGGQIADLTAQSKVTSASVTSIERMVSEIRDAAKNDKKNAPIAVTIGTAYGANADQLAEQLRLALVRIGKRNGNKTLLGMA